MPSGRAFRLPIRASIGLALVVGVILERGVQVVHIGRVVLVMVNLHRLGVDVRLKRSKVIRQRRYGVFGHGLTPVGVPGRFLGDTGIVPAVHVQVKNPPGCRLHTFLKPSHRVPSLKFHPV